MATVTCAHDYQIDVRSRAHGKRLDPKSSTKEQNKSVF